MKMKTYYVIEDDAYGQHGTIIEEVKMTKDKYLEVKSTGCFNGFRCFITDKYISALYYTQD